VNVPTKEVMDVIHETRPTVGQLEDTVEHVLVASDSQSVAIRCIAA